MSATIPQPPRPMMPPAAAGATQGMATPQNPLQMKLQQVMSGGAEIFQIMSRIPGVDKAMLQQAAQTVNQGFMMLVKALPQGAAPGSPPTAGQPPPQ